jgi:hypothetical protein
LEIQLDELDKSFINDLDVPVDNKKASDVISEKRYLKKQSFMDKVRNKMSNDLSLYGYDKK